MSYIHTLNWTKEYDNSIYTVAKSRLIEHLTSHNLYDLLVWSKAYDNDIYTLVKTKLITLIEVKQYHKIFSWLCSNNEQELAIALLKHVGIENIKIDDILPLIMLPINENVFKIIIELDVNKTLFTNYDCTFLYVISNMSMFQTAVEHGVNLDNIMCNVKGHIGLLNEVVVSAINKNADSFLQVLDVLFKTYTHITYKKTIFNVLLKGYSYKKNGIWMTEKASNSSICKYIGILLNNGCPTSDFISGGLKNTFYTFMEQMTTKPLKSLLNMGFTKQNIGENFIYPILHGAIKRGEKKQFKLLLKMLQKILLPDVPKLISEMSLEYFQIFTKYYTINFKKVIQDYYFSYCNKKVKKAIIDMVSVDDLYSLIKEKLSSYFGHKDMTFILESGKLTHANLNRLLNVPANHQDIFVANGFTFINEFSPYTLFPLELHNTLIPLTKDTLIMKELQAISPSYNYSLYDTAIILNVLEKKLKSIYNKFQIDICK